MHDADRSDCLAQAALALILTFAASPPSPALADDDDAPATIELAKAVAVERVGAYGRRPFHLDYIQSAIVRDEWTTPEAGDEIKLPRNQNRTWQRIEANDKGAFRGRALRGGYISATIELDDPAVMMLEARGHRMVYVNGRPRVGDIYNLGNTKLPVQLNAGENELLFHCTRGRLRATLMQPTADVFLTATDITAPDALAGEPIDSPLGVIVVNATDEPLKDASIRSVTNDGEPVDTPLPAIAPMTTYKAPVPLEAPAAEEGPVAVDLTLMRVGAEVHELAIELDLRQPDQPHKRTFISAIDGSAQYYSVVPAQPDEDNAEEPPGLVLTLHGASVEATSQANAYDAKDWTHIVAPTNRRPFGFDWEDWGRRDTLEALEHAAASLDHDPQRVYLTGHSMGGHGTWHIGVTYPDRFAAIAPSAAWISFWSYSSAVRYDDPDPIEILLLRATNASDTLAHKQNFLHHGIYMLHGDKDDNVPVSEARTMRKALGEFHTNFTYYERPGAGHWWGSECVDWPPLFDFLRHNTLTPSEDRHRIKFYTSNPGISAQSGWATIVCQRIPLEMSSIDLRWNADDDALTGTTDNVRRLTLDLAHVEADGPIAVKVDDQSIETVDLPEGGALHLERDGETWTVVDDEFSRDYKGPHRYGPFKAAFDHDALLVYATQGREEANRWALHKAVYDAEAFWYRGNSAFDIIADVDFDPADHPDRSVILYGNADTNAAWDDLLADSPVTVSNDGVTVGGQHVAGDDLATLFIRPRAGSDRALVAVIGGATLRAMRSTDRLPYFVSGVGYPDFICFTPDVLRRRESAVKTAGYFGHDWTIESGDFAWADDARQEDQASDHDSGGDE